MGVNDSKEGGTEGNLLLQLLKLSLISRKEDIVQLELHPKIFFHIFLIVDQSPQPPVSVSNPQPSHGAF